MTRYLTLADESVIKLDGIAAVGPVKLDYTIHNKGRPYFVITYQCGGVVEFPGWMNGLGPAVPPETVPSERIRVIQVMGAI